MNKTLTSGTNFTSMLREHLERIDIKGPMYIEGIRNKNALVEFPRTTRWMLLAMMVFLHDIDLSMEL